MKFSDLTSRSDVQETDQLIGYRNTSAGGEGRWTFAAIRSWLATIFAPLTHTHTQSDIAGLSTSLASKVAAAEKGTANGVATLGSDGKVPTNQLPDGLGGGGGAVSSVAGRTGDVVLTKIDVGLSAVENTSDANKPVSTAQAAALAGKASVTHTHATSEVTGLDTALAAKVASAEKGVANGVASLGSDGKVPSSQLPTVSVPVTSVAGRTGTVTLAKADVGLGSVDNTSDVNKPVSTAQQAAITNAITGLQSSINASLAFKLEASDLAAHTGRTDNPHTVTKAQVGLGNVDNTSDADKPVSTAQSELIATKLDAAQKGAASGVAPLGSDSKVPAANLPDTIDGTIQIRSGLDTDVGVAVLARDALLSAREIAWDESRKGLRVGDGSTPGGELINGLPVPRANNTTAWDNIKTANSSTPPRISAEMDTTLGIPMLRFPQVAGGTPGAVGVENGALQVVTGISGKDFSITKVAKNGWDYSRPYINSIGLVSGITFPISGLVSGSSQPTLLLTHTTTFASLTLTLPTTAPNSMILRLVFFGAVTSLTLDMGTATLMTGSLALPTSATAGQEILLGAVVGSLSSDGVTGTVSQWVRIR